MNFSTNWDHFHLCDKKQIMQYKRLTPQQKTSIYTKWGATTKHKEQIVKNSKYSRIQCCTLLLFSVWHLLSPYTSNLKPKTRYTITIWRKKTVQQKEVKKKCMSAKMKTKINNNNENQSKQQRRMIAVSNKMWKKHDDYDQLSLWGDIYSNMISYRIISKKRMLFFYEFRFFIIFHCCDVLNAILVYSTWQTIRSP